MGSYLRVVFVGIVTLVTQRVVNCVSNDAGCQDVDGGGWTLVRHVSSTNGGIHPATDNCTGTDVYGTYDNDAQSSNTWSISFDSLTFNQFLFAFGDCSKWLVTTPEQVYGEYYGYAARCILNSSLAVNNYTFDAPYEAEWYFRVNCCPEDPWITLREHSVSKYSGEMLYGEASYSFSGGYESHSGANVWIRYKSNDARTCDTLSPSLIPSDQPSTDPTSIPSNNPSLIPSSQPSNEPTSQPSGDPTTNPTNDPSANPTVDPTVNPSNKPSDEPSSNPTDSPIVVTTMETTEKQNEGESSNTNNSSSSILDGDSGTIIWILASFIVLSCICCCFFMIVAMYYFQKHQINNRQQKAQEKDQLQQQLVQLTQRIDSLSNAHSTNANTNSLMTNANMNTNSNEIGSNQVEQLYQSVNNQNNQNNQNLVSQDMDGPPNANLPGQPEVQLEAEGNQVTKLDIDFED